MFGEYMMKTTFRKVMIFIMIVTLNLSAIQRLVYADMIATEAALSSEIRTSIIDKTERYFAREKVKNTLVDMGVGPDQVLERVALLTDEELAALSDRIDQAPVGGDALAVIGIVFLVLMILEFVGAIDIFKKV